MLTKCRECHQQVSDEAIICPHCGAPKPSKPDWNGYGYEYKSKTKFFGLPLLHISFKYSTRFRPVPAKGIIAIGQFGFGVVNISQFGIGLFSLAQFTIAGFAVAQFAVAHTLIAQVGIFIEKGYGQVVISLAELLAK